MFAPPEPEVTAAFARDGYVILRDVLNPTLRQRLAEASRALLVSGRSTGRDRGADGKDGFRGCVGLDQAFLPLVANPRVLPTVVALLSPNIHLLSSHLIALPSTAPDRPRTIRIPERPGWHRDMYGVAADLGHGQVPRMALKCAYYLSDLGDECGLTMFLPGSHTLTAPPEIPAGSIDPTGAITPDLGPCDAVLFENRTWHAGGINTSGRTRLAIMMQYGYRWLACVDNPAPHLLHTPGLDPIERQLLGEPDRGADGSLAKGRGAAPLRRLWEHQAGPVQQRNKAKQRQ